MKEKTIIISAIIIATLLVGCAKDNDTPTDDKKVEPNSSIVAPSNSDAEITDPITEPETKGNSVATDFYDFMSMTYGELKAQHELEFVSLKHGGSPFFKLKDLGEVYVMFSDAVTEQEPSLNAQPFSLRISDSKYKVSPGIRCGAVYSDIKQAVPEWDEVSFSSDEALTVYATSFSHDKYTVSVWWNLPDASIKDFEKQVAEKEADGTYEGDVSLDTFSEFIKGFINEPVGTIASIEINNING